MIRRNNETNSDNGIIVSRPEIGALGIIQSQPRSRPEDELPPNDSLQGSPASPVISPERNVFEGPGGYFKYTKGTNPDLKRVSNVIFRALAKVQAPEGWFFECAATKQPGDTTNIILGWNDFQSGDAFKRALSKQGLYEFYGNSSDTTEIQGILSDQNPPTKVGLKIHGMHKINERWVYIEGNQAIDSMGPASDIVALQADPGSLKVSGLLSQTDISSSELTQISMRLHQFNDKTITFPILGYIGYCFLKKRLSGLVNQQHPILLLQGEPGTGKSRTISRIIQPLFCSDLPLINIADCTEFTAAVNSSSTNLIPVCYDEWKLASVSKPQKRIMDRMILATYSGTPLQRGKANSGSLSNMEFSAPMILAGEMTNDSPSLKHRLVELYFSYAKRKGTEECFNQLVSLPLGSCGKGLLVHSLGLSDIQIQSEYWHQQDGVDPCLNDRFRDNAALLRMGLWLWVDFFRAHNITVEGCHAGYSVIDSVINEMLVSSKITNVDRIIEDFSTMAAQGVLIRNEDFEVKDDTVRLKIASVYAKYDRWAKRHATAEPFSKHSFLQQIAGKEYFRGKKTMRIGGKERNGIEVALSDMPGEVSLDGFRDEGARQNSTSGEADDDDSWLNKVIQDQFESVHREGDAIYGVPRYNKDGSPSLTYLLQDILYDDQETELEFIMDELWKRNHIYEEKYGERIVKMLLKKRKDLFGEGGTGFVSKTNGRRYWQ